MLTRKGFIVVFGGYFLFWCFLGFFVRPGDFGCHNCSSKFLRFMCLLKQHNETGLEWPEIVSGGLGWILEKRFFIFSC